MRPRWYYNLLLKHIGIASRMGGHSITVCEQSATLGKHMKMLRKPYMKKRLRGNGINLRDTGRTIRLSW